jgi:hypothetical protein
VPQELGVARDPRSLGVAVRRIVLAQARRQRAVEPDAASLIDGYHAFEPDNGIRWTDDDAAVPAGLFADMSGSGMLILHLGEATQTSLKTRSGVSPDRLRRAGTVQVVSLSLLSRLSRPSTVAWKTVENLVFTGSGGSFGTGNDTLVAGRWAGGENTNSRPHVMAGLDPAIGYPQPIANDAIPVSNHPMKMTGSSPVMTGLDHCVPYVNSKGGWYYSKALAVCTCCASHSCVEAIKPV